VTELNDTPNLAATYCPDCDPGRDPLQEILTVRWCDEHQPKFEGLDDDKANVGKGILNSTGEAEAGSNRPWCELVHRAVRAV
jgi:hypothetical protein